MNAILSIFWGVVVLSFVVAIHEAGHYYAARLCKVRVLEFFLGLPSHMQVSRVSKKYGTRIGVTALLFGGFARIAGMDLGEFNPWLKPVFGLLMRRGRITADEACRELLGAKASEGDGKAGSEDADLIAQALNTLVLWGSAHGINEQGDILPVTELEPVAYITTPRDAAGNNQFDGAHKSLSINAGAPFEPLLCGEITLDELFSAERAKTYAGKGLLPRLFMLLAGIMVNLVFAMLVLSALFFINGTQAPTTQIASVVEGSAAQAAGIIPDDQVISIGGQPTKTWVDITGTIAANRGKTDPVSIEVVRNGSELVLEAQMPPEGEPLGIAPVFEHQKLGALESIGASWNYVTLTGQAVLSLFNPSTAKATLDGSVSILGIAVEAKNAAQLGVTPLLSLMALISISLGLMNLLPVPPLDGGRVVIELIQSITRRPVAPVIQNVLSIIGMTLFGLLFIYMIFKDIIRYLF